MDYKLLGKRIREERLRLGKTQESLAEEVNISTAYLGQIERGERSVTLDKLIPLANKLGVSVDFLLAEYFTPNDDNSLDLIRQLFSGRTVEEKELAVHMVKLLFSYPGKISTTIRGASPLLTTRFARRLTIYYIFTKIL